MRALISVILLLTPIVALGELPTVGQLTCRAMAHDLTEKKRIPDVVKVCPIKNDPKYGAVADCHFSAFGEFEADGTFLGTKVTGVSMTYKKRTSMTTGSDLEIVDDGTQMDYTLLCDGILDAEFPVH